MTNIIQIQILPARIPRRLTGLALLLFGLINGASAIVTSDDPENHLVTPGEMTYGLNLDGVALIGFGEPDGDSLDAIDTPGCSAALIADRFLLTAAHCFDDDLDGILDDWFTMWPVLAGFELADRTVLAEIDTQRIHFPSTWPDDWGSDIAVAELLQPVPLDVPRYRVHAGTDEVGQQVVIAGYGYTGTGAEGVDWNWIPRKRAGLNRVELIEESLLVYDFDSSRPVNNALAHLGVNSDLGFGDDEAIMAWGDSGGPVFLDGAIAGVGAVGERLWPSDVTDDLDASWGELMHNARLSGFLDFLIATTGNMVRFVDLIGDFNDSGQRDAGDLDLLAEAIRANSFDPRFDLDASGTLDANDRLDWIHNLANTSVGDRNLDGLFDSQDLVVAFQSGQYEDQIAANSTWATGDWNGDGDFNSSDLTAALQDGGYEQAPRARVAAVPEPTNMLLLMIAGLGGAAKQRRDARGQ